MQLQPFLLAGVMQASGNQPPATNPLKAKQLALDLNRTTAMHGIPFKMSSNFPAYTVNVQRLLLVIRDCEPIEIYMDAIELLFRSYWSLDLNVSDSKIVEEALCPRLISLTKFQEYSLQSQTDKYKLELKQATQRAVQEYGAFGAPWIVIPSDASGPNTNFESFFGSDRFEQITFLLHQLTGNGDRSSNL